MKEIIRNLIPYPLLTAYRKWKLNAKQRSNRLKSTQEIFSEIYRTNEWGGKPGEFYSGDGTTDPAIAGSYLKCVAELAEKYGFSELNAVDLGCGDMRIGCAISKSFKTYTGVDIVAEMIEHHKKQYPEESLRFCHLDIIEDELPDGDVCFIRQVLQHLSNEQIGKVLAKLSKYKYVLITEHLPTPNEAIRPNMDKPHGADVRLHQNSGVYITEPPFNISKSMVEVVLEVEGHGQANYKEPWIKGVIRTILYKPSSKE